MPLWKNTLEAPKSEIYSTMKCGILNLSFSTANSNFSNSLLEVEPFKYSVISIRILFRENTGD